MRVPGGDRRSATFDSSSATARARRQYDAYASAYDRETGWYERVMLGDGRSWACSQAHGEVLEVAIGTGRNLAYYPPGVRLVGVDLSPNMLARARAAAATVAVGLIEADAQALPFRGAAFDTVVCTLGLSSIPDDQTAVREMHRVLRPGGHLVLLGHAASPHRPLRALQHLLERAPASAGVERPTDHQTRQVTPLLHAVGFAIIYRSRSRGGIIERLTASRS
jgi:ubiquinone/menaquinone biosynthesis C-methylase UbiE